MTGEITEIDADLINNIPLALQGRILRGCQIIYYPDWEDGFLCNHSGIRIKNLDKFITLLQADVAKADVAKEYAKAGKRPDSVDLTLLEIKEDSRSILDKMIEKEGDNGVQIIRQYANYYIIDDKGKAYKDKGGKEVSFLKILNKQGHSLLHLVVRTGKIEICKELLENQGFSITQAKSFIPGDGDGWLRKKEKGATPIDILIEYYISKDNGSATKKQYVVLLKYLLVELNKDKYKDNKQAYLDQALQTAINNLNQNIIDHQVIDILLKAGAQLAPSMIKDVINKYSILDIQDKDVYIKSLIEKANCSIKELTDLSKIATEKKVDTVSQYIDLCIQIKKGTAPSTILYKELGKKDLNHIAVNELITSFDIKELSVYDNATKVKLFNNLCTVYDKFANDKHKDQYINIANSLVENFDNQVGINKKEHALYKAAHDLDKVAIKPSKSALWQASMLMGVFIVGAAITGGAAASIIFGIAPVLAAIGGSISLGIGISLAAAGAGGTISTVATEYIYNNKFAKSDHTIDLQQKKDLQQRGIGD